MSRTLYRSGGCGALFGALALLAMSACQTGDSITGSMDDAAIADATIVTVGHGKLVGSHGRVLTPSRALIERTQRGYLDRLQREAGALGGGSAAAHARIASEVSDVLLADALYIDWLIDTVQPDDGATLRAVNATMRHLYLDTLAPSALPRSEREHTKGLGAAVAKRLAADGIHTNVSTANGGEKYIQECAAAGVPIPPPVFSEGWVNRGILDDEFIAAGEQAEVMQWTSDKPAGLCIALPRYLPGSDDIGLLGMICLGAVTSKVCFWDSPSSGPTFHRNVPVDIKQFVGGFDLDANGQGVCTDCHAGENPYIVHPERPPFVGFSQFGSHWYEPIVHPSWPQNPGPTNLLAGVSSPGRCDGCHDAGRSGGRFPAISTELAGYCAVVLGTAALNNALNGTMPPFGQSRSNFINHIDALRDACNAPPSTGKVVNVDVTDNPSFLSPPMVIDPLYACASKVAVRGAVLDATVKVFVNGSAVASHVARNPNHEEFNVPALVIGDVVTAQQKLGVLSAMSAPVTVRDHKVDYPAGLPAPTIDPTLVYECADLIAVRSVPGAKVTVFSNGGMPVSGTTATDWTMFGPAKHPFVVADKFTAKQSLCADSSPESDKVTAVTAPSSLPGPTFEPSQTYPGQQLVTVSSLTNGSHTSLGVSGTSAGGFSTPVSWWPDYDLKTALGRPLVSGDAITAQQKLCASGPTTKTPPTGKCEDLPAPRIYTPIAGTNYVTVWQAVPGARIRIYDGSNIEIGDGSGNVIVLGRNLVVGDVLTVVQQIGECTSKTGYRISVRAKKQ